MYTGYASTVVACKMNGPKAALITFECNLFHMAFSGTICAFEYGYDPAYTNVEKISDKME